MERGRLASNTIKRRRGAVKVGVLFEDPREQTEQAMKNKLVASPDSEGTGFLLSLPSSFLQRGYLNEGRHSKSLV